MESRESPPKADVEPSPAASEPADASLLHLDPVATIPTTAINIMSNVVGAGVLAIPSAVAQMSMIPGILTLTIFGALSAHSMMLLTVCAQRTGLFTYKDLINFAFGTKVAGRAFDFIIFLYTFGCCVAYASAVADSMPPVMQGFVGAHGVWLDGWLWLLIAATIFFPLSSMRQLSELKFTSTLGFAIMIYVTGVIVVQFLMPSYELPDAGGILSRHTPWFNPSWSFFQGLPLASVGFSCHYNIPVFYGEMRRRSPARMMRAVVFALPVIFVLYVLVSFCSVAHFAPNDIIKEGDILKNFPSDDVAMNIGRLGMFFHFVCVYPILCIASRRSLNSLVFNRGNFSRLTYVVEAFFLVAASCTLAWAVNNVNVVFDFIGAMFGISIVIVIPNVLYLRIIPRSNDSAVAAATPTLLGGSSPAGHAQYNDSVPLTGPEDEQLNIKERFFSAADKLVHRQHPVITNLARVLIVVGLALSVLAFSLDVKHEIDKASAAGDNTTSTPNSTTSSPPPPPPSTTAAPVLFG